MGDLEPRIMNPLPPEDGAGVRKREHYRLIQDGLTVAQVEGPDARAMIDHYAAVYAQDGPVHIEQRVSRRWRSA